MRFRIAAAGLLFVGCYSSGEGIAPPLDRIYFPVGLAIDKEQKRLYVASSDFDLQFNAGSVQALDLERIRGLVPRECETDSDCNTDERCDSNSDEPSYFCVATTGPNAGKPCGAFDEQTPARRATVPGRCSYVDLLDPADDPKHEKPPVLVDHVGIGAFATDVEIHYGGPGGVEEFGRLFIPVRGESSLHWIELDKSDGKMHCGQTEGSPSCDRAHRVGTDPAENSRGVRMPAEPFGIAISDAGDAIVITHQTTGQVSLFHQDVSRWNSWDTKDTANTKNTGPNLEFVQTNLPTGALGISAAPSPKIVRESRRDWLFPSAGAALRAEDPYPPAFLVAYSNSPQLDLLRYYADVSASPPRPFLQLAATVGITANTLNVNSRGIAYDDGDRKACEAECEVAAASATPIKSTDRTTCLAACAAMPIDVYVANRSPASLLVGKTIRDTLATPNRDVPKFIDSIPLPTGPSRVYIGKVVGATGELETRIFVVCFDQRRIAMYDPKRKRIESFITTGRGPHAMAFDYAPADLATGTKARAFAYVGHFTDSYVGVVELDRRKIRSYANIVLSLGPATAPRASK